MPSDNHLYPNFDWIIGNHSDELTPWLPIIAAKSSMTTRFFVIPCCAHDFQSKFLRKKSEISLYSEYLGYIEDIGNVCGFDVCKDRLRIPSTKRICLIGQTRNYDLDQWEKIKIKINEYLSQKCPQAPQNSIRTNTETWSQGFKARNPIQEIKNCTQIRPEIRDKLVNEIAFLLLAQQNFVKVNK